MTVQYLSEVRDDSDGQLGYRNWTNLHPFCLLSQGRGDNQPCKTLSKRIRTLSSHEEGFFKAVYCLLVKIVCFALHDTQHQSEAEYELASH